MTGNVLEKTLRSGEKVESADVMDTDMEYLYFDGNAYVFMDSKSYEQISIQPDSLGKDSELLQENLSCMVTLWNGQAIAVKLPNTITAVITYTEPAIKGDTQSRVLKEATIDTGATVQVPTFIDIGERITVDTRSRQYLSRVNK